MQVEAPPEWAEILTSSFNGTDRKMTLRSYSTQLVARGDPPDPRLGSFPFPAQRGRLSSAALAFIRDGAPELWPDWEAAAVPTDVRPRRLYRPLVMLRHFVHAQRACSSSTSRAGGRRSRRA